MLKPAKCFNVILRVRNMSGGSSQSKSLISIIQRLWILWTTFCSGLRNFILLWRYRSSASAYLSMAKFCILLLLLLNHYPSYCITSFLNNTTFLSVWFNYWMLKDFVYLAFHIHLCQLQSLLCAWLKRPSRFHWNIIHGSMTVFSTFCQTIQPQTETWEHFIY